MTISTNVTEHLNRHKNIYKLGNLQPKRRDILTTVRTITTLSEECFKIFSALYDISKIGGLVVRTIQFDDESNPASQYQ